MISDDQRFAVASMPPSLPSRQASSTYFASTLHASHTLHMLHVHRLFSERFLVKRMTRQQEQMCLRDKWRQMQVQRHV